MCAFYRGELNVLCHTIYGATPVTVEVEKITDSAKIASVNQGTMVANCSLGLSSSRDSLV